MSWREAGGIGEMAPDRFGLGSGGCGRARVAVGTVSGERAEIEGAELKTSTGADVTGSAPAASTKPVALGCGLDSAGAAMMDGFDLDSSGRGWTRFGVDAVSGE